MGLFSFIGGLIGGGSQKKASREAAQLQYDAAQDGIAEERRQYDQSRADFAPFRDIGVNAADPFSALLGIGGPEAQMEAIASLQGSPLYQSLYDNGEEALLQTASATGGLRGGNTQRGLADFGRDTLSSVIQQQIGNLGGAIGIGTGATGAVANLGANSVAAQNQLRNMGAGAKASDALTRGGINAQNWQNAGSGLDSIISSIFGGGGF